MRRSPLGLHLPDADQFTAEEIKAAYDLSPSLFLTLTYCQWDNDKGAAQQVRHLVGLLEHTDLYVRFHADPNPIVYSRRNDGPEAWARLCARRMEQYYGELAARGVRLHAILANETDADYEGGLSPQQASQWYGRALTTYADLRPQDVVHVPAPTGAPQTHREHLEQYKRDGWVRQSFVIDGHGYDGDLENVINVLGDVFPDNRRAITETNDLHDFGWPIALLDQGKVDHIVYFILNWARGGQGRVEPPSPDDAAKRMSILRFPDRYQQFLATIRDVDTGQHPPAEPPEQPQWDIFEPEHFFSFDQIAAATDSLVENVREHWTATCGQLRLAADKLAPSLFDPVVLRAVELAMIGNFAVETGPRRERRFTPVREAYWLDDDHGHAWAEEYRRTHEPSSRYFPYYGRGKIQTTWAEAYAMRGGQIAELWGASGSGDPTFDLISNPDNLLDRDMSAAADVLFFVTKRAAPGPLYPEGYTLIEASVARDYVWIRKLVQGADAGLDHMTQVMDALDPPNVQPQPEPEPQPEPTAPIIRPVFNPHYPVIPQNRSFDCSETALLHQLRSHGRQTTDQWLEDTMIADGIMTRELGLMDATGRGLAAFGNYYYGGVETPGYVFRGGPPEDLGFRFRAFGVDSDPVDFDEIAGLADGTVGYLLGGRRWYHWCSVRFYDRQRDVLIIANSAHGHMGVYQELTRAQFAALGWWSAVAIEVVDVAQPSEPPVVQPAPSEIDAMRAKLAELSAAYDEQRWQLDDARRNLGVASVDVAAAFSVAVPKYHGSADRIDDYCAAIVKASRSTAARAAVEQIRAEAQNVRVVTRGDIVPAIETLQRLKP